MEQGPGPVTIGRPSPEFPRSSERSHGAFFKALSPARHLARSSPLRSTSGREYDDTVSRRFFPNHPVSFLRCVMCIFAVHNFSLSGRNGSKSFPPPSPPGFSTNVLFLLRRSFLGFFFKHPPYDRRRHVSPFFNLRR